MITLKSAHEIELMRRAGKITAAARALARDMVRPGVTTQQIDKAVFQFITEQGATPSFLHYNGYPASVCVSVNDEIIHGIPGKRVLQEAMERERAMLVCSDMYIIDGDGKQVADSITKVRRHHVFRSGTDLARGLLTSNFVTGCTMLIQSDAAKRAIPFCPYMVHDHYIALCCAAEGMVYSSPERTIRYRIHGGNQTGLVVGVADKASYGKERIEPPG